MGHTAKPLKGDIRKVRYRRISKAFENEPIVFVKAPSRTDTIMWRALLNSMENGTTTCRRYMDAYAKIGSSSGSLALTEWIHHGNLAWASPEMRLQPGGSAYRLVSVPETSQPSFDFAKKHSEIVKPAEPTDCDVRFYMVSGQTAKLDRLEKAMSFMGIVFEVDTE